MVPGIDDVMFTVSVKYDVVALDPNTNSGDTSVQLNSQAPESFTKDTIFLYK